MLRTSNTATQTLTAGSQISLGAATIETGGTRANAVLSGSNSISLRRPCYYKVSAVIAASAAAANIVIDMMVNGVKYSSSKSYSAAVGQDAHVVFDEIVPVNQNDCCCTPTLVTFVTEADATVDNITVNVDRLC